MNIEKMVLRPAVADDVPQVAAILRVPSMMMTGGKKEMLSRNVLIFRRTVTGSQMAMFSVNWKSRSAR